MSVPAYDVLEGMATFYKEVATIKQRIGERIFDTIAPERIVAMENTGGEQSPRVGAFVEYEKATGAAAQNLDEESTYNVLIVTFRFHALRPSEARALFTLFYDATTSGGRQNRYGGTWKEKSIKLASWDLDSEAMAYDDTFRMTVLNCNLYIRFASA